MAQRTQDLAVQKATYEASQANQKEAYEKCLADQKESYDTVLSELKSNHDTCLAERDELTRKLENINLTVTNLEGQLTTARCSLVEQIDAKSNVENDLIKLRDQLQAASAKFTEYEAKLNQLEALNKQLGSKSGEVETVRACLKDLEAKLADASNSHEAARQAWNSEKAKLAAQKDEELQKNIEALEKRFVEDYATFMQTHKEAIQRTLSEKSSEFAKEKDKLMEMYEKKLGEHEVAEARLRKQMKEIEQRRRAHLDAGVQTEDERNEELVSNNDDRVEELMERISGLEELIGGADAHFEQEIERLKGEMEEDFRAKMEYEMEKEEERRGQLVTVIEELKKQLKVTSCDGLLLCFFLIFFFVQF